MGKLVIVGAGGFGREILSWVEDVLTDKKEWQVIGFLDDNPKALDGYNYHLSVIGTIDDYQPRKDEFLVMGIASSPLKKLKIAATLKSKGGRFISLVHPSVIVGKNVKIGDGCIICRNVIFTCDILVGDFVTINILSTIGHDVSIGDGCTLHPCVSISGFAQLGQGVLIGTHGSLLPGAQIGDFATVGAGSVVIKNVEAETTVLGVPAKRIL
jgi:sugar O-acyltransferase (sialic acid O-acetyltransferase NeuD family)